VHKKRYIMLFLMLTTIFSGVLLHSYSVNGNSTVTSYISIPCTAFQPEHLWFPPTGYGEYEVDWNETVIDSIPQIHCRYSNYAPVLVPHRAILTNMSCYFVDTDVYNMTAELLGFNLTSQQYLNGTSTMAEVGSQLQTGWQVVYDDTIDYAEIDNKNCIYTIRLWSGHNDPKLGFTAAILEYEIESGSGGVGGLQIPIDKLELLTPYVALAVVLVATVVLSAYAWKHWTKRPTIKRTGNVQTT